MHVAITFLNITCKLSRPAVDFKNLINSTRGQLIEYIKESMPSGKLCYNAKCFKSRLNFFSFSSLALRRENI